MTQTFQQGGVFQEKNVLKYRISGHYSTFTQSQIKSGPFSSGLAVFRSQCHL